MKWFKLMKVLKECKYLHDSVYVIYCIVSPDFEKHNISGTLTTKIKLFYCYWFTKGVKLLHINVCDYTSVSLTSID